MAAPPVASLPAVAADRAVILPNVSWETYERLLADQGDRRAPRLTFDRGVLEIVSPSPEHEMDSRTLALLVEIIAAHWDIDVLDVGSMTYRRRELERGFEPDTGFYIRRGGRRSIDPAIDPPPDLVIEIDASHSSLDKFALFARLGVPEIWRHDQGRVTIHQLVGDAYRAVETSVVLPPLTAEAVNRWLGQSRSLPRPEWFRRVGEWAQAHERRADAHP